jgi:hypothetical protein
MNAHDRRVTDRYWPHCINVSYDDDRFLEIHEWLNKNFGSSSFRRRRPPRWCWRPNYTDVGNFAMVAVGSQLHFRKEKDYMAFLLRWDHT